MAAVVAKEILDRLPRDAAHEQELIRSGHELAQRMSWDAVAETFIFPAIQKACAQRCLQIVT